MKRQQEQDQDPSKLDIVLSDIPTAIAQLDTFVNKLKAAKKIANGTKYKLLQSKPTPIAPCAKAPHRETGAVGYRYDSIDGIFYPLHQAAKYAKRDAGELLKAMDDNAVYSVVIGGTLVFPQAALDMYKNLY